MHLDCFDSQVGLGVVGTFACYQGSEILRKLAEIHSCPVAQDTYTHVRGAPLSFQRQPNVKQQWLGPKADSHWEGLCFQIWIFVPPWAHRHPTLHVLRPHPILELHKASAKLG